MSARARELLERARAAEKLDGAASQMSHTSQLSQRISEGVLEKLARGESPLPGIDVAPVALPKLSWWSVLFNGSGLKSIVLLGAGLASVATFAALRTQSVHEPMRVVQAAPVVASGPAPMVAAVEPAPAGAPSERPAAAPAAPVTRRHEASTRAAAASKKDATSERARAKAKESARALRISAAAADGPAVQPTVAPTPSAAQAPPKVAAVSGQLDAELGLLRRAYSALHAGKPADAQALLDEHNERFPHGSLEEPREVAHMIVLCKMGRDRAARVRAETFLALHPKSPFVPRVRSICTDSKD